MSRTVRLLPAARRELDEAFLWYETKSPGLGTAFRTEADRQFARISEHPLQFPEIRADIRRARLQRFPYGVFFRIDGDEVFVIAFFHAARNPRNWQGRA